MSIEINREFSAKTLFWTRVVANTSTYSLSLIDYWENWGTWPWGPPVPPRGHRIPRNKYTSSIMRMITTINSRTNARP
jgi:hypothetical protein